MIDLREGDTLPMVAACQVLLNAYRLISTRIEIDGVFGRHTRDATKVLQEQNGLEVTGIIDGETWKVLARGNKLSLYDSVDIFDPDMSQTVTALQRAGIKAGITGGMCNGVAALHGLLGTQVLPGKLVLLRFQGHGNKGKQVISYGTGHHLLFDAIRREAVPDLHIPAARLRVPKEQVEATRLEIHYSSISVDSLNDPTVAAELVRIRPFFHPLGSVEFHGCHVGAGPEGTRMLQRVADLLGVPTVGALKSQYMVDAMFYRGALKIRVPGGGSLHAWGKRLPEITQYD